MMVVYTRIVFPHMNRDRINEIEARAQDVLLTVFEDESAFNLPINLSKIASTLELTLKEGDFKDKEVIGAYDKDAKTIYVAKNDPYPRRAFTIAHEMGHFVLHDDKKQETFFRKDLIFVEKTDLPMEQEANCFAANILMPKGTLIRYQKIVKDPDYLADIFGVSKSAMLLRLQTLGLGA